MLPRGIVPARGTSPVSVPPPWSEKPVTSGVSRPGQLPKARNALPGGAGPAAEAAVPRPAEGRGGVSAETHLPGRPRARVPGGRSVGMVRAPCVHSAPSESWRASLLFRSLPSAAPARGPGRAGPGWGRGPERGRRRSLLASATCRSPGDAALATRAALSLLAWGRGRAAWDVRDTASTTPVLSSPGAPRACPDDKGSSAPGQICSFTR